MGSPVSSAAPRAAAIPRAAVAAALLAAAAGGARASDTSVLDRGRFYASPVGEVRWLDADGDRVVVSDLRVGVAAFDPASGRVAWSHGALGGRLDRLWRAGERLVAAGVGLEGLDVRSGRVLWSRDLDCATEAICAERALWAGEGGVLVAGRGARHERLGLLGLADGRPRWARAVEVASPRWADVRGDLVAVADGEAPWLLRFVALADGAPLGTWAWTEDGAARPLERPVLRADGTVALLDADAGPDCLARVALVEAPPTGAPAAAPEAFTRAVPSRGAAGGERRWTGLVGRTLWTLGRDEGGDWLGHVGVAGHDMMETLRAPRVAVPLVARGVVLVAEGHPGGLRVSGLAGEGGAPRWRFEVPAPPGDARWVPAGAAALLVLEGDPAPLLLVDPESGDLLAVGELAAPAASVQGARLDRGVLYVAAGRGVHGHALVPVSTIAVRVESALARGDFEGAMAAWAPAALLVDRSEALRDARDALAAARRASLLRALRGGARAAVVRALAEAVGQRAGAAAADLALLGGDLALLVGEGMLPDRRPWDADSVAALVDLGEALAARLGEVGDRYVGDGPYRDREPLVRAAVLSVAAALLRAGRPAGAADLLSAWLARPVTPEAGVDALRRVAAVEALAALLADVRRELAGREARDRERAAARLRGFPWSDVALDGEVRLGRRLDAATGEDRAEARRAGQRLARDLAAALRSARRELGRGLGEPGCAAVCRALAETCPGPCRDAASCAEAGQRCLDGCSRAPTTLRWSPPPLPEDAGELAACL